ncbi:MAG: cytochrome b N-terminal domain-containing protein [Nitrospinae bacterium]|nr:cytochrome b N-terminal domain-containing protein [Nitrospinota bacterium]MBF0634223.1 cytochrome b N-terminal domain-containing protein [Nitrospinota bacterium]
MIVKEKKHIVHHHLWTRIKPRNINFRHYFGGAAFLLILAQFITGLYMIFYYEPSVRDTYKTVQFFNNETLLGAFTRNIHRYGAFLLVAAAFIHMARGYFRRDYQGGRKWNWITGVFLFMLMLLFTVTGSILPWEWKGYWMMEMFNNWLRTFPLVGERLYDFFMTAYTPTRNFAIHDIILPIITFILLEIHCLSRMKKRGFWDNMARQSVAALPLIAVLVALAVQYPVPTEDPEVLPLPMDGQFIPAPEWFFVTFLLPYWYFPARVIPVYLFWLPLIFFAALIALPYLNKRRRKAHGEEDAATLKKQRMMSLAYIGTGAIVSTVLAVGLFWGSVKGPWMGCNCCHNVAMGDRMGIPPVTYKDTKRNPLLLDNRWMMRHWYEPQVVW